MLANKIGPLYLAANYHQKYTAMLQTTLQFDSLFELWKFKTNVQATSIEVDTKSKLLTTELSPTDIQLACIGFAAKLVS